MLIGRLNQNGLAAGGEEGVGRVLDNLAADIDPTMGLYGRRSIAEVGSDLVTADPGGRDGAHAQNFGWIRRPPPGPT